MKPSARRDERYVRFIPDSDQVRAATHYVAMGQ
jgi:hypothetical protein